MHPVKKVPMYGAGLAIHACMSTSVCVQPCWYGINMLVPLPMPEWAAAAVPDPERKGAAVLPVRLPLVLVLQCCCPGCCDVLGHREGQLAGSESARCSPGGQVWFVFCWCSLMMPRPAVRPSLACCRSVPYTLQGFCNQPDITAHDNDHQRFGVGTHVEDL